ncbi:MAG: DUF1073 domain-containing protein [Rhodospirillales bacterium]|nr:DUF1073 domain-containing protein [Rhodospirillales bacterium]
MSILSKVGDSFVNFASKLGYGAGNITQGAGYQFDYVSRNRLLIEAAYRSSWVIGQAIDVVAEDMTAEGIEITSTLTPEQLDQINTNARDLQIWDRLCDTVKWARLYGGCVAFLMIDGQNPSTPLRPESIRPGAFRGILPLDRWMLTPPDLTELVGDMGPAFGQPAWYNVIGHTQGGIPPMRIHHTRAIRIDGVDLPYFQRFSENGWGQSVVERIWDRLIAFDSTTAGAAQLVYKAHLRTIKIQGLRNVIANGGAALTGLLKNIDMIRLYQSNEGMTLLDGEDEFEAHQYSFSGLAEMMDKFSEQIAGATQIPLIRLLGQSPKGFSTGDTDVRNYYDRIKQDQERRLRTGVHRIYELLAYSLGIPLPQDWAFNFRPLWKMSDTERGALAQAITTAVQGAEESGLVSRAVALKELRQQSHLTGLWSNITDEDIADAELEPPPSEMVLQAHEMGQAALEDGNSGDDAE